jgi:hypothetical protein
MPGKCKYYLYTCLDKESPFFGKKYLYAVWDIRSLNEVKRKFFSIFKNLNIPTETLWIHHPIEYSKFRKYDNPTQVEEISCFFGQGIDKREKRRTYNLEKFETENSLTRSVKLVVGRVPYGKKRSCSFKISFTLNWQVSEERYIGGEFKIRYHHQVEVGGFVKGEFANDDVEDTEKLDDISDNDDEEGNKNPDNDDEDGEKNPDSDDEDDVQNRIFQPINKEEAMKILYDETKK